MSCGLAILVETPAHSPVRRRLWPATGQRAAEALHFMSAEAVASIAEVAQRDSGVVPYWAIAEEDGVCDHMWSDLPLLRQGPGALEKRLARVYDVLLRRHGAALLLCTDTPQLAATDLAIAASWLVSTERRLILGRTFVGGFWLFGANMPIHESVWSSVKYHRHDTAACMVDALHGLGRWRELHVLRDLDTAEDLAPVRSALTHLPSPTEAQTRLCEWLGHAISGLDPPVSIDAAAQPKELAVF